LSVTVPEGKHVERIVISSRTFAAGPDTLPAETVFKRKKMLRNSTALILVDWFAACAEDCLPLRELTAFLLNPGTSMERGVMGYRPLINDPILALISMQGGAAEFFHTAWSTAWSRLAFHNKIPYTLTVHIY
jgi:hypothetical protein